MQIHKRPRAPLLRTVSALLFLAVSAWTGAALYGALSGAPPPVAAAAAPEGIPLQGIAVRQETPLYGRAQRTAQPGSRVAAGGLLAVTTGGESLYADASVLFFPDCDGLEALGPEQLSPFDADLVRRLLDAKPADTRGACGRAVSGRDWYYAALAPTGTELAPGARCALSFDGLGRRIPARLVAAPGDGALLLRLSDGGADCLSLRKCGATLFLPGQEAAPIQEKEG